MVEGTTTNIFSCNTYIFFLSVDENKVMGTG